MTTTPIKPQFTFEQFLENFPDAEERYELVNGEIIRILPTRRHETIAELITDLIKNEVKRLNLNYFVSGRIMIRTFRKDGK